MKLKVIKAVKGLVPGDILDYNEKDSNYEILKVEEDITESGSSKKSLKVTIPEYLVDDFKEFFTWVDDDGNDMKVEEFRYKDSPNYESDVVKEVAKPSEPTDLDLLRQKVIDLEKQLDEYKNPIDGYIQHIKNRVYNIPVVYTYNPYRTIYNW
jgi:hypothetical protein